MGVAVNNESVPLDLQTFLMVLDLKRTLHVMSLICVKLNFTIFFRSIDVWGLTFLLFFHSTINVIKLLQEIHEA